jgi:hypothetical protein
LGACRKAEPANALCSWGHREQRQFASSGGWPDGTLNRSLRIHKTRSAGHLCRSTRVTGPYIACFPSPQKNIRRLRIGFCSPVRWITRNIRDIGEFLSEFSTDGCIILPVSPRVTRSEDLHSRTRLCIGKALCPMAQPETASALGREVLTGIGELPSILLGMTRHGLSDRSSRFPNLFVGRGSRRL